LVIMKLLLHVISISKKKRNCENRCIFTTNFKNSGRVFAVLKFH